MRLRYAFLGCLAASATVLGFACSSETIVSTPSPAFDSGTDPSSKKDATVFDPGDVFTPTPDAGAKTGQVFAHTARSLHRFEPYTKVLTKVGDFDCLVAGEQMIDIALNESGAMYGTTLLPSPSIKGHFVTIDPITAKCTVRGSEDLYPDSLGFVPSGTLDPVKEALVGFDYDYYVRIDVDTGKMTDIGMLNPPDAGTTYYSSGDIVAIIGDKAYLTARDDQDLADSLLEVDPKTGRRVKVIGSLATRELWGAGYWGGKVYAFSSLGEVLEVNPTNAAKTVVAKLTVPDGGTGFYGAGVTTAAPKTP